MFCPKCGNKVENQAKFCDKCGEPIAPIKQPTKKKNNAGIIIFSMLIIATLIFSIAIVFSDKIEGIFNKKYTISENNNSYENDLIEYDEKDNTNVVESSQPEFSEFPDTLTKEEVMREAAIVAKEFYLSYLEAIDYQDEYLIENCTEELRKDRAERMRKNKGYTYENDHFYVDMSSVQFSDDSAVFKIRVENTGTDKSDWHTFDNIVCMHIEMAKKNGEWFVTFVNQIDCILLTENVWEY